DLAFIFFRSFGGNDLGVTLIVRQGFLGSFRLGGRRLLIRLGMVMLGMVMLRRRAAGMDEDFLFLILFPVFRGIFGRRVRHVLISRSGIQRPQRRHLGLFLAVAFLLGLVFLGFAVLGRGAGDLEAFDIVFLAAAGFRFLFRQQRLPVGHGDLVVIGMDFGKGQ